MGCACLVAAGCSQRAAIRLEQPEAPPSQRDMRLTSDWAFSDIQGGRSKYVLEFPLPGSTDGPKDFVLYLAGAGAGPQMTIDPANAEGARGFLIQSIGERRGKTLLAGGTVRIAKVAFKGNERRLTIDATAEDGTKITGRAAVIMAPADVEAAERRYAADVLALWPATSQPAEAADVTAPRTGVPSAKPE